MELDKLILLKDKIKKKIFYKDKIEKSYIGLKLVSLFFIQFIFNLNTKSKKQKDQ